MESTKRALKKEDVTIIGGGPAGMISAIQLKRYGISARIFESNRLGGLLWNANLVENYPGFPGGIPGPELVRQFKKQFETLSLEPTREMVVEIDFNGEDFVITSENDRYISSALIIATGTRPIQFPAGFIPEEAIRCTFYEVAPLLDVQDRKIAIIGAGDAAFDYALNLSRNNEVFILNRGQEIKALPLLVERCAKIYKIQYLQDVQVVSILHHLDGLILEAVHNNKETFFHVDLLIGAIGREENIPLMSKELQDDQDLLIESGRLQMVGDVHNGIYRQTAIAVGDGLKAAMKVYQFLKEKN